MTPSLRRSGLLLISGLSLAIAVVTYIALHKLNGGVISSLTAQSHIFEFKARIAYLQANVEGSSIGESDARLLPSRREVDSSFASLSRQLPTDQRLLLSSNLRAFLAIVDQEIGLIKLGRLPEARELDEKALDPAFDSLSFRLQSVRAHLDADAQTFRQRADWLLALVLLGAAASTTILMARQQKKVAEALALEAQRNAFASSNRRSQTLVRNSPDVIVLVDRDGAITYASGAVERIFSITPEQAIGLTLSDGCHPDDAPRMFNMLSEVKERPNAEAKTELRIQSEAGRVWHMSVHTVNLLQDPDVGGVLVTFHDLTERKNFEEQLSHQAFHDKLTGLPNRALFMDRLSQRLTLAKRRSSHASILFLDLDNFKIVNDSLGHDAGDALLIAFAESLKEAFRASDTISRLGGDEFVILLGEDSDENLAIDLAKRVLELCESPFHISGREIFVTPSIGIASLADSMGDADSLLRDADTAMYQAKASGKSSYVVFNRSMNEHAMERLVLESDLRRAIKEHEFILYYQPIFSIGTSEIIEIEALVRWQHPTRGIVAPIKFIPVAEETGLIVEIGEWVLREACMQLGIWTRENPENAKLKISVNVSGRQLNQPGFAEKVEQMLSECMIRPDQLTLEITETFMLTDLDLSAKVLQGLRSLGIGIAIDDFGTGYSSMSYLSKLPIDTLKIDRSFVNELVKHGSENGILQAMIVMARGLGLHVVSEGIETQGQLEILQNLGCELGQGFLLAKPMTANSLTHLLDNPSDSFFQKEAA